MGCVTSKAAPKSDIKNNDTVSAKDEEEMNQSSSPMNTVQTYSLMKPLGLALEEYIDSDGEFGIIIGELQDNGNAKAAGLESLTGKLLIDINGIDLRNKTFDDVLKVVASAKEPITFKVCTLPDSVSDSIVESDADEKQDGLFSPIGSPDGSSDGSSDGSPERGIKNQNQLAQRNCDVEGIRSTVACIVMDGPSAMLGLSVSPPPPPKSPSKVSKDVSKQLKDEFRPPQTISLSPSTPSREERKSGEEPAWKRRESVFPKTLSDDFSLSRGRKDTPSRSSKRESSRSPAPSNYSDSSSGSVKKNGHRQHKKSSGKKKAAKISSKILMRTLYRSLFAASSMKRAGGRKKKGMLKKLFKGIL